MKLANRILVGLVAGILVGLALNAMSTLPAVAWMLKFIIGPVGDGFIRLIKMIVVPLVLSSLIVGTASLGDVKKIGRIGGKILIYYMVTTAIAVSIGLVLANVFAPGDGLNIATNAQYQAKAAPTIVDTFLNMIPTNPFDAMVKGDMLQIIVFAILFGLAAAVIGELGKPVLAFVGGVNETMMQLTTMVMSLAPYAVFCLIAKVVATQGIAILLPLLKFIVLIYFGLFLHAVFVYGSIAKLGGGMSPIQFFKRVAPAMLFAFSSASSSATLPLTIECGEKNLGIKRDICSFTLPLGATINMDGTALYQGVAAIFLAQLLNIPLTFGQMATIVLSATLASIGTAGVPGAGMIMLAMVLESVGLPVAAIGIIMGVDRIIDMGRTSMNVAGDLACTLAVAKSEGAVDMPTDNQFKSGKALAS